MNRNVRTAVNIAIIIAGTIICGALAYFITSALVGHHLATASNNMNYTRWQEKFSTIVIFTGGLTGICSLIWFGLARGVFKIDSASGVGRRTIWAALAVISLIGSIAIPQIYSAVLSIKINIVVTIMFVIFFTLLGYWGLSIFTTPTAFKYTPLGAELIRTRK